MPTEDKMPQNLHDKVSQKEMQQYEIPNPNLSPLFIGILSCGILSVYVYTFMYILYGI